MTVAGIRKAVAAALEGAGYQPGSWAWVDKPNRLVLTVRGQLVSVRVPGGSGKAMVERCIGYLQGLAEGARILDATVSANGQGA